jgi:hypothetical protein
MAEDKQAERRPVSSTATDAGEQRRFERSIDPQTVFDGATAYGAATGGTGTLLLGIAAVKKVFGSGQKPAPDPQQPKED